MAIQTFKEIIDNKGYRINSKDRKIFEEGNLQSFFGFSENDMIEFVVYDTADNELPQADGQLARYIPLTTDNIRDYLMIPNGTIFQQNNFPKEYFVDAERLLRETGYNNGTFKTQITLLNSRAGKPNDTDKLWIQEISPSRLEIRLLPLRKNGKVNTELEGRFDIFVNGGEFREDVTTKISSFIESINPQFITEKLISNFGQEYFNEFLEEYKINDFDIFIEKIYTKFKEVANYEFTNRYSDMKSENYGREKTTKPKLDLSIKEIKTTSLSILIKVIDFYLHTPLQIVTSNVNVVSDEIININKVLSQRNTDIKPTANDRTPKDGKIYSDKMEVIEEVIEKKPLKPNEKSSIFSKTKTTITNNKISDIEEFTPREPTGGVIDKNNPIQSMLPVPLPIGEPIQVNTPLGGGRNQPTRGSISTQNQKTIANAQQMIQNADAVIKQTNSNVNSSTNTEVDYE